MKKTILNPLLALAGCLAAFNGTSTLQAQTTNIWDFNYTGSIVTWTVPISGYYDVTAYGARGGGSSIQTMNSPEIYLPGGLGAVMGGRFLFNQGEILSILAGGTGTNNGGSGGAGGGGGGSFVVASSTNPLVVAGGGGGVTQWSYLHPLSSVGLAMASITTSGNDADGSRAGSGGTNGYGGTVGSESNPAGGGGGGGFFSDGQSLYGPGPNNTSNMYADGGSSFLNGGAGGSGGYRYILEGNIGVVKDPYWLGPFNTNSNGGFGGGGQASAAGGGGGGYSGGGGGSEFSGGGGGSFLTNSASGAVKYVGHAGNGRVSISQVGASLVGGDSVTISNGSTTLPSIILGSTAGDTNESLSVVNAGTVVDSVNHILVGQNGSNNAMTVSGGASVAGQAITVVGLNATASGNSLMVTGTGSTWSSSGLVIGDSGTGNSMSVEAGAGVASAGSGVALGYNVGSSGNSLTVDGSGSTLVNSSDLAVGFSGSGNAVVISNGGTMTNGQQIYGGAIGLFSGASNNSVLVTGSGSAWNNGGDLLVGWGDSGNTLTVSNGGAVTSSQVNYGGVIGLNASSTNNSVLVTGSGSAWNISGDLTIGDAGGGTLTVANGGSFSADAVTIASQAGSSGTLNFGSSGGSDTAGNFLPPVINLGLGTATVNFNQTDTVAVTVSGAGFINQLGSGTTILTAGTNTLAGGVFQQYTINGGSLVASGVFTNALLNLNHGNFTLTGEGSTWNAEQSFWVGYNNPSNSAVISNGASMVTSLQIGQMMHSTNNSVVVTGAGSSWNAGNVDLYVGVNGSGNSMTISDGASVSVSASNTYGGVIGLNASSANNSVLVTGTGSIWHNDCDLTIGYSGQGTLTVANGGTATSTAPEGITVASQSGSIGTLNIGGFGTNDAAGTINAPKITFGAGTGTINFNQTNATTISAEISGNGTVNQLGSGTTTLTGNNSYSGATTVASGTLLVDGQIGLSDVSVLSEARIGGSGTLAGSLSMEAGARFVFSLTGALTVNGLSVTFADFGIDDLVGLDSSVADGAYTIIDGTAAINFSNVANLGQGNAYDIGGGKQAYFSTGSLVVNVVPEPSTYALLALAAAGMGGYMLRHRRK